MKIITLHRLSHRRGNSELHAKFPILRVWHQKEEAPEHLSLKTIRALSSDAPQDLGKQKHHLWRVHKSFHLLLDSGQSSNPKGAWARPTLEDLLEIWCSLWGQGHWWQRTQGISIGMSSPRSSLFGTYTWPHPKGLQAPVLRCLKPKQPPG